MISVNSSGLVSTTSGDQDSETVTATYNSISGYTTVTAIPSSGEVTTVAGKYVGGGYSGDTGAATSWG